MVEFADTIGGYVLRNDIGEFTVYDDLFESGSSVAGPGYIAHWTAPDGAVIVDGLRAAWVSANDPRIGGIAIPAWHHYRANGESDIWNRGWEINPLRRPPAGFNAVRVLDGPRLDGNGNVRLSLECDFADVYEPMMTVRHDYLVEKLSVRIWVTFTQRWQGAGFPAFIKEPKLTLGFAAPLESVELYDVEGTSLQIADLTTIRDPAKHTLQLRPTSRGRVRLLPADVNIIACACDQHRVEPSGRVTRYGIRKPWVASGRGLDGWAEAANGRQVFEQANTKPYCLQGPGGTLSRNWEIAKIDDTPMSLMLHGWEGGTGLPDCLACARSFGADGERWTVFVSVGLATGWRF